MNVSKYTQRTTRVTLRTEAEDTIEVFIDPNSADSPLTLTVSDLLGRVQVICPLTAGELKRLQAVLALAGTYEYHERADLT